MVGGSTQRTVQYSLYSLLYNIIQNYIRYIILQQCQDCYTVPHKVYTLNQVTLQYQFIQYNTGLLYRYIFIYRHFSSKVHYITVHLYICRHYCITLEQYTFLGNSTHYTYFYSFTLAAALSHSTVQPSPRLSACQGRKGRERKRKGGGGGSISLVPPTTVLYIL